MRYPNAIDFGVPQNRKRVIFIGFRQDLERGFDFELVEQKPALTLKDAIWDLREWDSLCQLKRRIKPMEMPA